MILLGFWKQSLSNCTPSFLGMTLVELVIGKFPFPPNEQPLSVFELLEYIVHEPVPTLPAGQYSKEFEEFIAESLIKDQNKRPGPSELLVSWLE